MKTLQFLPSLFLVAMVLFEGNAAPYPAAENITRVLNDLMKKPYDKRVRPLYGENALFVRVSFNLESIMSVNERFSELMVRLVLRQSWLEPRLTFSVGLVANDTVQLNPEQAKLLWTPDTVVSNQRSSEQHEGHTYTSLSAEGLITTSVRMTLTTDCPMKHESFPFDVQTCNIKFSSYSLDRRDVVYEWSPEEVRFDPVPLLFNRFDLLSYDTQTWTVPSTLSAKPAAGTVTALVLRLHFNSNWRNYVTTFFTPMIFFTFISIVSLRLLSPKIGVLINLLNVAIMNLFLVILMGDDERAVVSSRTAMDQYVSLCFFFVFTSLLVDLANVYFERNPVPAEDENDKEASSAQVKTPKLEDEEIGIEGAANPGSTVEAKTSQDLSFYLRKFRRIVERISGRHAYWILFLGFGVLNVLYWGAHTNLQTSRAERIARL